MAVAIRLQRIGRRKKPFFRVVAIDSRKRREGRPLETIGTYNPKLCSGKMMVDKDRYQHWVKKGAQVSDTVRTLIKNSR